MSIDLARAREMATGGLEGLKRLENLASSRPLKDHEINSVRGCFEAAVAALRIPTPAPKASRAPITPTAKASE